MVLNPEDNQVPLYRSTRGDVACADHAPLNDTVQWRVDQWRRVPTDEVEADGSPQCQRCANDSGAARATALAKPLILNVDDRPASQYAREHALRSNGFAVVNANTGAAALDVAQRLLPSLVLLDIHLPDADGRDVCRQMKADAALSGIPVVLISATLKAHSDNLDSLRWGGADGYVTEPCEPTALVSMLRNVLTTG
jgi:CheY-like chemotaxis protein